MNWMFFLAFTILFWGSMNLFFKGAEGQINQSFFLFLMGLALATASLPFVLSVFFKNELIYSLKWVFLSSFMGILFACGAVFFFLTFEYGASSSIAIPIFGIGALIVGAFGSLLIYHESLSIKAVAGMVLGIVSILLLGNS